MRVISSVVVLTFISRLRSSPLVVAVLAHALGVELHIRVRAGSDDFLILIKLLFCNFLIVVFSSPTHHVCAQALGRRRNHFRGMQRLKNMVLVYTLYTAVE